MDERGRVIEQDDDEEEDDDEPVFEGTDVDINDDDEVCSCDRASVASACHSNIYQHSM